MPMPCAFPAFFQNAVEIINTGLRFTQAERLRAPESVEPRDHSPPKSAALLVTSRPIIKAKRPITELKISMMRILTKLCSSQRIIYRSEGGRGTTHSEGSAASANAAPLPLMPTDTPQIRLQKPTVMPVQNMA